MSQARILGAAKDFVYKNARLLDRKRYEYHFEGGTGEDVVRVLRSYQNGDGGFGNALECDIRCPHSQPVPTELALTIMDEAGYFDPDILEGIARYLRSITLTQGGFPFVFGSAADYPHAPWWRTDDDGRPSINPTGRVLGLLYKQREKTSFLEEEWFRRSASYVWQYLADERPTGYHDGIQLVTFLEHTPDVAKREAYRPSVDAWLTEAGTIERDPSAQGYVHKVLDWCPQSDSYARKFVSDEDIDRHLQALVEQQQADGGWPISWEAISAGTEIEWRGWITVERLRTLKSYGFI